MRGSTTRARCWLAVLSLAAILLGLVVPGAGASKRQEDRIARSAVNEPVRLMVQLQGAPLAEAMGPGAEQQVLLEQQGFRERLRSAGLAYREIRAHKQLFNGLVIQVPSHQVGQIAGLRGVAGVFPVGKTRVPVPQLHSSIKMIGAPQAWAGDPAGAIPGVDGAGITVAVIDTGKSLGDRT